jgi:signal transduction histidine kinase
MASRRKAIVPGKAAVDCHTLAEAGKLREDTPSARLVLMAVEKNRADPERRLLEVNVDDGPGVSRVVSGKAVESGTASDLNRLTMASGIDARAIELEVSGTDEAHTNNSESTSGTPESPVTTGGRIYLNPAGRALFNQSPENTIFIVAKGADGQVQKLSTVLADAIKEVGIARALRESREELRRLSGLLVSVQEDERRRIALDLHDGLGQSVSLIKLAIEKSAGLLAAGATQEAGESLRQLIPRVEDALVEVRRVSTDLRPLMLDDLGILPTLSWFFREFETVCGGIVVEKTLNVAEKDVPAPLHITLYRILQEAFHNIVKHAGADRVRVRLDRIDDALQLSIEDNGRGFDPDSVKWVNGQTRGLGLLSMKERASFSGGTYLLDSAPGKGTCIKVTWPAGICPAAVDCCRMSDCSGAQVPCRPMKTTQFGDPKNTVHRV